MGTLYKYKYLKYGFIILCPNLNIGYLKNTISSMDIYYPEAKTIIVLPGHCKKEDMEMISKLKTTYKGDKTIASMINTGIEHAYHEWNFILFPKGWIRNKIDIKYSYFVENEKDILFPIINRNLTLNKADINGMFIHYESLQDIGNFPDMESLDISKLIWANKAIEKGYKFKGIVGAKSF